MKFAASPTWKEPCWHLAQLVGEGGTIVRSGEDSDIDPASINESEGRMVFEGETEIERAGNEKVELSESLSKGTLSALVRENDLLSETVDED